MGDTMNITQTYESPIGEMLIAADELGITGLWFKGQKYYASTLGSEDSKGTNAYIEKAFEWLEAYFSGDIPKNVPRIHLVGTQFQIMIWQRLLDIPYGATATYGELARTIAFDNRIQKVSPRAVGVAVGHNPISVIVPCHRVIGYDGSLTGYAGGLDKKEWLLNLEAKTIRTIVNNDQSRSFNFGYPHQVYASSPSLTSFARVVCSPFPLPSLRSATRMFAVFAHVPSVRAPGPGLILGGRPTATLTRATTDIRAVHTSAPPGLRPVGATPPYGQALLI